MQENQDIEGRGESQKDEGALRWMVLAQLERVPG
jgi:hypothetical protein